MHPITTTREVASNKAESSRENVKCHLPRVTTVQARERIPGVSNMLTCGAREVQRQHTFQKLTEMNTIWGHSAESAQTTPSISSHRILRTYVEHKPWVYRYSLYCDSWKPSNLPRTWNHFWYILRLAHQIVTGDGEFKHDGNNVTQSRAKAIESVAKLLSLSFVHGQASSYNIFSTAAERPGSIVLRNFILKAQSLTYNCSGDGKWSHESYECLEWPGKARGHYKTLENTIPKSTDFHEPEKWEDTLDEILAVRLIRDLMIASLFRLS